MLLDARSLQREQVPLRLERHGLVLLVIDTRAVRRLAGGQYAARRRACEEAARVLSVPALRDVPLAGLDQALTALPDELRRRVRHVVTENGRVLDAVALLRADQITRLGRSSTPRTPRTPRYAMTMRSRRRSSMSPSRQPSGQEPSARLTGAGFGGCAIALVESRLANDVSAAVERAFDRHGFAAPRCIRATAAIGARRVVGHG
jgi:galactokinase